MFLIIIISLFYFSFTFLFCFLWGTKLRHKKNFKVKLWGSKIMIQSEKFIYFTSDFWKMLRLQQSSRKMIRVQRKDTWTALWNAPFHCISAPVQYYISFIILTWNICPEETILGVFGILRYVWHFQYKWLG